MPPEKQDRKMEKIEDRVRAVEIAVVKISSATESIDRTMKKLETIYTESLPRLSNLENRVSTLETEGGKFRDRIWQILTILLAGLLGISVGAGGVPDIAEKVDAGAVVDALEKR